MVGNRSYRSHSFWLWLRWDVEVRAYGSSGEQRGYVVLGLSHAATIHPPRTTPRKPYSLAAPYRPPAWSCAVVRRWSNGVPQSFPRRTKLVYVAFALDPGPCCDLRVRRCRTTSGSPGTRAKKADCRYRKVLSLCDASADAGEGCCRFLFARRICFSLTIEKQA